LTKSNKNEEHPSFPFSCVLDLNIKTIPTERRDYLFANLDFIVTTTAEE
jgi:hypothetical protein